MAASKAFQQHKERESRFHSALYANLCILSINHPQQEELKRLMREDIFLKPNKAAFFQVIYYLLNILNPSLTEAKLPSWPPLDLKMEHKLRNEIINYVNELNEIYKDYDIFVIKSSHLVAPCGFRFIRFIFSISQLVLCEDLKRITSVDLNCPKGKEDFAQHTSNIKKLTESIHDSTQKNLDDFQEYIAEGINVADKIKTALKENGDEMLQRKCVLESTRTNFNEKYSFYPSLKTLQDKFVSLKMEYEAYEDIQSLSNICCDLFKFLNSSATTLVVNNNLKIPKEVMHIIKSKDELNLNELLEALNVLLLQKAGDFPNYPSLFIKENQETLKDVMDEAVEVYNKIRKNNEKIQSDNAENILTMLNSVATFFS